MSDPVLQALEDYERLTRGRRYGGMLHEWRQAKEALRSYRRQLKQGAPRQLRLLTSGGDRERDR